VATAIGLDIGSSAVRAVQLSRTRGGAPTLDRLGQVVLEPETVVDGVVHDSAALTAALRILWQQFGFKGRKVVIGLANQQVVVRLVDLPRIPEGEQFGPLLRSHAAEHLPMPLDEVEFDHVLVEQLNGPDGTPQMRVLLVAADKLVVATTVDAVKAAKLRPLHVDLDAFAQIRALRNPVATAERFGPGEGEAIVNAGAHLTSVVVHTNGTPRFVRTVAVGGEDVTESLAAAFDLDWEAAETIKSVAPGASSPYTALLEERIGAVVEEVRSSLAYYGTLPGSVGVERLVLTGGSSLIPGLGERLSRSLRVDVVEGRPFRSVTVGDVQLSPAELDAAQPFFAVAVGLALRALG
jgi:type IV pilus assembly protein PilM